MLDFAWSEFLVVIIVAVIVIGPKQLPEVLFTLGRLVRRLQYMKFAMSQQFEDFMEKSDLNDLRNLNQNSVKTNIIDELEIDEEQALQADIDRHHKLNQTAVIAKNEVTKQSSDGEDK